MANSGLRERISILRKIFGKSPAAQQHLHRRDALAHVLEDIMLPDRIVWAFLLPSDAQAHTRSLKTLQKHTGSGALTLRECANEIREDEKRFQEACTVRNPMHPIHEPLTVALLDLFVDLQSGVASQADIENGDAWISAANHFGLWQMRYLLEDALFAIREPDESALIHSVLETRSQGARELFQDLEAILRHHLNQEGHDTAAIESRAKNVYGVYLKRINKSQSINHVHDFFGIRIVVNTEEECFAVRDLIHRLWPPFEDRLKDYITHPKDNGYRSLHTTVSCLGKSRVEFQIRTREMDAIAKQGPANYALYKSQQKEQIASFASFAS